MRLSEQALTYSRHGHNYATTQNSRRVSLGGLNVVTAALLSQSSPPQRHILCVTFGHYMTFALDRVWYPSVWLSNGKNELFTFSG